MEPLLLTMLVASRPANALSQSRTHGIRATMPVLENIVTFLRVAISIVGATCVQVDDKVRENAPEATRLAIVHTSTPT